MLEYSNTIIVRSLFQINDYCMIRHDINQRFFATFFFSWVKNYSYRTIYLAFFFLGTWLLARQKTMATQSVDPYPITTDSTNRRKTDNCGKLLIQFLLIYWKSFVIILWPLILLPIFIIETTEVRSSFFQSSFSSLFFSFF